MILSVNTVSGNFHMIHEKNNYRAIESAFLRSSWL